MVLGGAAGGAAGAHAHARLRDGRRARLARSTPARYVEGGYATHHYVPQPPTEQSTCFELLVSEGGEGGERGERGEGGEGGAERSAGYIAFLPYGTSEPHRHFPTAVAWRTLHAAQVERLGTRQ